MPKCDAFFYLKLPNNEAFTENTPDKGVCPMIKLPRKIESRKL